MKLSRFWMQSKLNSTEGSLHRTWGGLTSSVCLSLKSSCWLLPRFHTTQRREAPAFKHPSEGANSNGNRSNLPESQLLAGSRGPPAPRAPCIPLEHVLILVHGEVWAAPIQRRQQQKTTSHGDGSPWSSSSPQGICRFGVVDTVTVTLLNQVYLHRRARKGLDVQVAALAIPASCPCHPCSLFPGHKP